MKSKYREIYGVVVSLFLVFVLSGCAGMLNYSPTPGLVSVTKLPVMQVIDGVKQVLTNAPGSAVMVKNNLVLVIWAEKAVGYNFYVANATSAITMEEFLKLEGTPLQALNAKNYQSFYDLKHQLVVSGWRMGALKDIPNWLLVAVATASGWAVTVGSSLPTFMFIPIICDSLVGNVCGLPAQGTQVSYVPQ